MRLEAKAVDFRYTEKSPYVLKNLSFAIEEGERIGVAAPSGCGKTTCTMLDVITQAQIWRYLLSQVEQQGIDLIVVSHNPALIEQTCSRVVALKNEPPVGCSARIGQGGNTVNKSGGF